MLTAAPPSRSSFFLLRDKIEQEIAKSILSFGKKSKLRDACEYALLSGGKRLRPIIVMMVAEALGHDLPVGPAALAVEFLHTASLIADDLPCMDNDPERRDRPSVHRTHGESVAMLASYSLIFAGFEKIYENAELMKKTPPPFNGFAQEICCIALQHSSHCAGILGATYGQFLDLFPPNLSLETVRETLQKKTGTLFEVSFVFGWIFGGGMLGKLDLVKQAANHFGMAFQIVDDLGDLNQDEKNQRKINIAATLGKEKAFQVFQSEINRFKELLQELEIDTGSFEKMNDLLHKQALTYFQN